ncbi:MAG: PD-(D/E)XK nuclease family protein, partial [Syntrophaceae bacterium]|nr:PD-(D/E)XK nuclease family protein [Syntrophaceae bacterium]
PFLFYHQYILGIKPPAFMDDDEKINMHMGDFVHRFLQQLSAGPKKRFDDWEKLFDEIWKSNDNAEARDIEGINIYMLNAKVLLQEIYADEKDSGARLVFADNALCCEEKFEGIIDGCYKITGRSDRIANIAGRTEVIDFKYTKKQSKYDLSEKTTVLKRFQEKGVLHPAAQLIIYQYFNKGAQGARFYFLKEPTRDREIELPPAESAQAEELMQAIRERLDAIIGGGELAPVHDCSECEYCQFQVLCGREDYYKTVRGNL